jgi:hypothetical protein
MRYRHPRHIDPRAVALALTAALALGAVPANADSTPAIQVLQRIPTDVLDIAYPANPIPKSRYVDGLVGVNVNGWEYVGEQRTAMIPIMRGAVTGDAALVDKYFPAIDQAFAHQLPDGSFDYMHVINGKALDPRGVPTGSAFFLVDCEEALLLLRQSSLAPRYAARIDALIPRFQAALAWIARPTNVSYMIQVDSPATNRYFVDAGAFLLGDLLAHSPEARQRGEEMLTRALARQSPAGWFPEHSGADSSYNAVSMMRIADMALFINDPRLDSAISRALSWELSRIRDTGEVDTTGNTRTGVGYKTAEGNPYSLAYMEITRMFAVVGAKYDVPPARAAAERVATFHRQNPRQTMGASQRLP